MLWTKDSCKEEALKYKNKRDFRKYSYSAYSASIRNKWYEFICLHMNNLIHVNYWTKEKCAEESLKYKSKTEFKEKSPSAYTISCSNKWIDDICSHMINIGNRYNKCIYVYEFSDKSVYIGLTYNIDDRKYRHKNDKNSSVYKYIEKTNLNPIFKQITDYIIVDNAIIKEGEYVEKYKNDGWNILNKSKTGSIGGNIIKWTKEKCKEEALKFNNKKDFIKNNESVYNICIKRNWLSDICSHMIELRKPNNYWTKERCHEEALKYKSKTDFIKNNESVYNKCLKRNWLNDICTHMRKSNKIL
jgi:predicted GIY-YIG superfamily endonuclease